MEKEREGKKKILMPSHRTHLYCVVNPTGRYNTIRRVALHTVHNCIVTRRDTNQETDITCPYSLQVGEKLTSFITMKHFYQSTSSLFPDKPSAIITSTSNIFTCNSIMYKQKTKMKNTIHWYCLLSEF